MARRLVLVLAVAALVEPIAAQERLDPQIGTKIRQEEEQHSQIMRTLHFLTDVYGPRLTGSPSLKAAGEWSIKTMESSGLGQRAVHRAHSVAGQRSAHLRGAGVDARNRRHGDGAGLSDDSARAADAG
jgi:hypothetical protein